MAITASTPGGPDAPSAWARSRCSSELPLFLPFVTTWDIAPLRETTPRLPISTGRYPESSRRDHTPRRPRDPHPGSGRHGGHGGGPGVCGGGGGVGGGRPSRVGGG